jgi:hypothetical protein
MRGGQGASEVSLLLSAAYFSYFILSSWEVASKIVSFAERQNVSNTPCCFILA